MGSRMSDALWKLGVLWRSFIAPAVEMWRREVWSRDPGQYYCCNGHECGCYGASIRDVYAREERL